MDWPLSGRTADWGGRGFVSHQGPSTRSGCEQPERTDNDKARNFHQAFSAMDMPESQGVPFSTLSVVELKDFGSAVSRFCYLEAKKGRF
jgi:hypothetical protein